MPEEGIVSDVDKNFLMAVRNKKYDECTKWLEAGANINAEFGKCSENSTDVFSLCGPNDTPLTHAVKKEDDTLLELLLKNRAKIEVFVCGETPLMKAAFKRNVKMVKLLLDAGADPNTKNQPYSIVYTKSYLTAMHYVFLGLRKHFLDTQKDSCTQTVDLLMQAGFSGDYNDIANVLKYFDYDKSIRDFFTQLWKDHHNKELENSYTQGAMVGAFCNLEAELSAYIGTFLGRREGGRLAQTCNPAAKIAYEERENKAKKMRENI